MTNKKNQKWAIPMIATCLLAACGSNDNEVEPPQTKRLTFGVTVDEASAPTSRNAEWDYEDTYTQDKKLALNWDAANDISVFHYKATAPGSWSASAYKGSLAVDKDNQKTVSVDITDWTEKKDGIAAFFPYNAAYSFADGKISGIEMPQSFTQSGKNATHLSNNMYMYGTLPCGIPGTPDTPVSAIMTLHHIPAVLRSLVINKGDAPRIINEVEIVASIGFTSRMDVQYTKRTGDNDFGFDVAVNEEATATAKTITVTCAATAEPSWNKLAATGIPDNASKADRLMAYALCFPTATKQTYTFKVTATDADGTNETTYTSNVIDSSRLKDNAFKSGYYYTFELLLDDKLTATIKEVTNMPGWDTETEL